MGVFDSVYNYYSQQGNTQLGVFSSTTYVVLNGSNLNRIVVKIIHVIGELRLIAFNFVLLIPFASTSVFIGVLTEGTFEEYQNVLYQ